MVVEGLDLNQLNGNKERVNLLWANLVAGL